MNEQENNFNKINQNNTKDTSVSSLSLLQGDRKAERLLLVVILAVQCYMLGKLMQLEKKQNQETAQPQQAQLSFRKASPVSGSPSVLPRRGAHSPLPAHQQAAMLTDMNRLINLFNVDSAWDQLPPTPQMDFRTSGKHYDLRLCMPPNTSSNINIFVEGRDLHISTDNDSQEFSNFNMKFRLPGPVGDASMIKSKLDNGVLHLEVPRHLEN